MCKLCVCVCVCEYVRVRVCVCVYDTGEYTAERLKELQKNALSFSSAKFAKDIKSQATVTAPAASQEPLLKLSGTFKPAGAAKDDRFTLNPMDIVSTWGIDIIGSTKHCCHKASQHGHRESHACTLDE